MLTRSPRRKILLVEDDPDYGELLGAAFQTAGFQFLSAANGEKAMQILHNESVDLVVSDFMMPELNGLELCRLINDDSQIARVRTVLYSGNSDPAFRKKARELGAIAYLEKTEDTTELVRQICRLVAWEQAEQEEQAAETTQLHRLLDSLLDFVRIAGLPQQLPESTRMALDAARRTGQDMKRLLGEAVQSPGLAAGGRSQPSQ